MVWENVINVTNLMKSNLMLPKNSVHYFGIVATKNWNESLENELNKFSYYRIDKGIKKYIMILISNVPGNLILMNLCLDILRIRKILYRITDTEYLNEEYFKRPNALAEELTAKTTAQIELYQQIIYRVLRNWNQATLQRWLNQFIYYLRYNDTDIEYVIRDVILLYLKNDKIFFKNKFQ